MSDLWPLLTGEPLNGDTVIHRQLRPAGCAVPVDRTDLESAAHAVIGLCNSWGGSAMPLIPVTPHAPIDSRWRRKDAADLVLHTQRGGGSSEQFAVIGWQAGAPASVARPPELDANFPDATVWYIGSSHGVHEWVTCADGAAVTMNKLSAPEAEGIPLPGGGIREENHFAFENAQWSPNGSENVADNNFSYDFDPHTQTFQCPDQGGR